MTRFSTNSFTRRTLSACLLTALLGTAALTAQAQSSPAPTPNAPSQAAPQGGSGHMGGNRMGRGDPEQMQAWHKRQQEALKAKLKLTPAQEGAWTNFTASMQPGTGPHADRAAHQAQMADIAKLPTPERIDRMRALRTQHMAEMNTQMDKRADATKAFYAALTPEQQKVFDTETSRMMQAWGQRGRGGDQGHEHGRGHSHEGGMTGPGRS